ADLHQVLNGLGAAAVLPDAGADEPLIPLDQNLARDPSLVAVAWQRPEADEQFVIGQPAQLGTVAERGGSGRCLRHGHLRGVGTPDEGCCARTEMNKLDRM